MPLEIAYKPIVLPDAAFAVTEGSMAVPCGTEVRPRDFTGRIRRRDMRSIRRTLRAPSMLRQRAAGVAMFGALGMLLGPLGWGEPGGIHPASAQERRAGLQPFERGSDNFPGSAFYWLEAENTGLVAPADADKAWEGQRDDAVASPAEAGGLARPIVATGTSEDQWRALQCLTTAIYYEAASEPDAGQRAVAQVVLNRVAHPAWPNTVCGVVYQGSERPSCQFSFACDGSLARKPMRAFWDRARRVAADALAGYVYAPVGLATHYHTTAVHPYWADSLNFLGTIGAHRFYRWAGKAGKPMAFTARYAGGEPIAAPHPRSWTPAPADIADPLALEKAFEEGRMAAVAAGSAGPLPASLPIAPHMAPAANAGAGPARSVMDGKSDAAPVPLQRSGTVLPQYENAGRWIAQPGA
ncbi:cell wall hydrolase [Novosphingobium sp. SL115]|uniref:cell wall hydrolase n=1 Tax=Novosphingobium sp. SL115 TaxID=2995150 RepID=UPI0022737C87|nr:cell wall hydrolase [Novosphingobium sp. SL115]MCY1672278.1 cell wall hydrolase [Novosphingobium sp. SL115]